MELETVAIYSLKDGASKWVINKADFDPAKHKLWDGEYIPPVQAEPAKVDMPAPDAVDFDEIAPAPVGEVVGDYITDGTGGITEMTIVDPDDKRARKTIPAAEYDPDIHVLWSERKR